MPKLTCLCFVELMECVCVFTLVIYSTSVVLEVVVTDSGP